MFANETKIDNLIKEKLNDRESKISFAKKVIGYYCFLKDYKITKISQKELSNLQLTNQINHDKHCIAYKIDEQNKISYFVYYFKCDIVTVFDINYFKSIETKLSAYYSIFDEHLLILFIYASANCLPHENLIDNTYSFHSISPKMHYINFILGAGVSIPYGIPKWDNLITKYKGAFLAKTGYPADNILKESYNTTYGIFQLVKDMFPNQYYEMLENSILCAKLNSTAGILTTLNAVANVIVRQSRFGRTQRVLTFNYDCLLEQLLQKFLDCRYVYKTQEASIENTDVDIIHVHGLIVEKGCLKIKKFKDSIVFSNDEYNTAYKNGNTFSCVQLKKQLVNTNIFVGNSISDYEEQKIIKNLYNDDISKFHVALMIKNPNHYVNSYNAIRLIKIGIICVFFDDANQMANYINGLIK